MLKIQNTKDKSERNEEPINRNFRIKVSLTRFYTFENSGFDIV